MQFLIGGLMMTLAFDNRTNQYCGMQRHYLRTNGIGVVAAEFPYIHTI